MSYPVEWQRVAEHIEEEPGVILALPLSAYRAYPWNPGRVVLDPAPRYLPGTVLTDDTLRVGDVAVAGENPRVREMRRALADGRPVWTTGVRWVLVQHEVSGEVDSQVLSGLGGPRRTVPDAVPQPGDRAGTGRVRAGPTGGRRGARRCPSGGHRCRRFGTTPASYRVVTSARTSRHWRIGMRRALTLVVSGLVAALLGILALGGISAAATAADEEAASEAKLVSEAAKRAGKKDPYAPRFTATGRTARPAVHWAGRLHTLEDRLEAPTGGLPGEAAACSRAWAPISRRSSSRCRSVRTFSR